ncbi:MAG TPA: response regulator [Vicinamibacterales bacterium]|jgi:DNA-binding response OmpR family regulator
MASNSPTTPVSPSAPAPTVDLLLVDASPEAPTYAAILRGTYRVAATASTDAAKEFLHRRAPAIVVTDLDRQDADGVDVCREAKSLTTPPRVLVTTAEAERVPDALAAGCDGVLLKPFPPNLLFARIGRLLRARSGTLRDRSQHQSLKSAHLADRSEELLAGTNREWPNTYCPYCDQRGVTSFEFCSHRRAWYACLACRRVWIAKRQE